MFSSKRYLTFCMAVWRGPAPGFFLLYLHQLPYHCPSPLSVFSLPSSSLQPRLSLHALSDWATSLSGNFHCFPLLWSQSVQEGLPWPNSLGFPSTGIQIYNAHAPTHSHQCTIMLVPTTQIYTYTDRHALSHMCIHSGAHNSTQVHKLVHMSMHTASLLFEALDPVDWQPPLFPHFSSPSSAQMLHSPGEMDMAASSATFTGPVPKCPAVGLISVVFNLMMICNCQQMSPH